MADPYRALCFGMRFNPTGEQAIARYLVPWLLDQPLPDAAGIIIHEAEVYKSEPKDLAAVWPRLPNTHHRFFFTTCIRQKAGTGFRMKRTAGAGKWVTSDKTEVKNSADETIGYHEKLRYAYKGQSGKSEWLMDEYHCRGFDQYALLHDGKEERVLCRLYVSPNAKPGSLALQQSAAADHLMPHHRSICRGVRGIQGPPQQQLPRRPQEQVALPPATTQTQAQAGMRKPAPQVADRQSPMVPAPMWSSATASSKPGYVARQQTATGDHLLRVQEPAIMAAPRPQARPQQVMTKPATPRGLDLSSGQQQCRVTVAAPMTTQLAPKRPAPPIAEPPHPKRMRAAALAPAHTRPAVKPASAAPPPLAVPPRRPIVSWEPAKRPSWCPPQQPNFLSAPLPQRQATKDKGADLGLMAEGQSTVQQGGHKRTIQQKACNEDTDEVLPEKAQDVDGKMIQQDGDEEDEFVRFLDGELEIAPEETEDVEGKAVQQDGGEEDEQEEGDDDFARFLDEELEIAPEETEDVQGKAIEEDDDEEERL
uniref:NAC domain-containing protein n=1 Tax=Triticum aestivum TaxID=4565 RepID=A0A3B6JGE4_WHEAT